MKKEKGTFGWVFTFAGQKKSGYIASVILAVIGAVFQILPFFVMAQVIGKLLAGNKDLAGYLIDCAVMAAFWLLRVLLHSLSTAQSHKATFAVLGNIRKQGLAKLAKMPLGDVQSRGSGELKNILVERVDSIEPTLAHVIPEMSSNAAVAAAALIYLFVIDWRMALASLVTFPLGMVFFMLMMAGYNKNYARTVAATNTLNDTAVEYIGGIEVIKVFGKSKSSYEKFVSAARECARSYIDWMNKSNFYFTFAMNIMPATLLSVLPIGGLLLKNGTLPPTTFVLIVILSMGLITPIIGCMQFTDDLAKVGTIISQVTDILTAPELSRPETDAATPHGSTVALHDVHFGYHDTEVLHGIGLTFREGTVNALVGPSGSGKSTIAKLIASFWDVGSGNITVGGADIRSISSEHYNQLVAYVSQENFLFDNLSGVSTRVVMLVTEGIFSTAVMTLAVFLFDWRVGLLIMAGLALYCAVNHALQRRSEQATRRKFTGDAAVVEQVLEFIKGIAEVKSYSLIGRYNRRLEAAIEENVDANTDMELKLLPLMLAQNAVSKLIDVAVVMLSLMLYTSGHMELLNCVMLCICSFLLTEGLEQAGTQSSLLRVVDTCVNQASDILNLPAMDISGAELDPENHDLCAENICFSYGEKPIINGITLTIPERTTVAIVGPSGSGKTTLCHLLSRFWDVDAGTVTLGGHDVREYDMDSLMRNFSFVFQTVYLFRDTVANNIRFGQPDASMEQVVAAAKKAHCHDFILKLPQGYETVIGEAGASLSGGERQRLSIARAMMKDAPIIILDEATANVDPENEKELMEAVRALTQEKTVIMIAHRLKTVRHADQILVVDKGQIVQRGTHDELMAQDGIYRRFISGREKAVGWKL